MSDKLPRGLYAIIDDSIRQDVPIFRKVEQILAGGVKLLQLRLERTSDGHALEAIEAAVKLAETHSACIIVNDRVDLALAGGAHGVHLGAFDLPVPVARRLLGPDRIIGATVRSEDDLGRAAKGGADYVGLGPVFPTSTKTVDHEPLGLERFAELVKKSPLPVFGIAGITLENIAQVGAAGAHGAAVVSGLLMADDLVSRARRLDRAFSGLS
jgi:thiamine-phosphate pyrophosphorylase